MWEVHHKSEGVDIEDVRREGSGRYDIQMDEEEIEVFHMEVVHKEDTDQLPYYYQMDQEHPSYHTWLEEEGCTLNTLRLWLVDTYDRCGGAGGGLEGGGATLPT